MRSFCRNILPVAALMLLLASCAGRDIIPRGVMADIYADMFLADQWILDHGTERHKADTSLFYDPILASYGYTFEQYDKSVKYYMQDPERFSKVFRAASDKLKKRQKVYERKKALVAQVKEYNAQFVGYKNKDFKEDTTLWKPPITDSLILDSLRRAAFLRDSLIRAAFVRDSLQRDSLMRDSVRRHNERLDSAIRLQRRKGTFTGNIKR